MQQRSTLRPRRPFAPSHPETVVMFNLRNCVQKHFNLHTTLYTLHPAPSTRHQHRTFPPRNGAEVKALSVLYAGLIARHLLVVHLCHEAAKQGSGFRVQGSGFRGQGSGFRVSGFRVKGSGFRVQGSGSTSATKLPKTSCVKSLSHTTY